MPVWLWFAPLGVLVVALGLWGFRLGWIALTITETDVIEAYATRYVAQHGEQARRTDCTARPGFQDHVWIVVSCNTLDGAAVQYPVDRFGRLLKLSKDEQMPPLPQT